MGGQAITLNAVGDLLLDSKIESEISQQGAGRLLSNFAPIVRKGDLTIGNLECPLCDRGSPYISKDFLRRASTGCAEFLKSAGFDIVCLANNHIFDYGPVGFAGTISVLKRAGISYVGAGENLEEACRPLIVARNGVQIAFFAFTYAYSAKQNRFGCCPCDLRFIQEQITAVCSEVDLVIVSIHHGIEYVDYPSRYIISLFRGAVDAGANLVLGHHPHVVQGIETYRGSLIAYSLGNFISWYPDAESRRLSYQKTALAYFTDDAPDIDDMRPTESFVLQCKLSCKGVEDYQLIPIKTNTDFQIILMEENEAEKFLKRIFEISRNFSNLDHPVWDEMDALWKRCQEYNLANMNFSTIIRNVRYIRPKHFSLIVPFLKAKFKERL